MNRLTLRNGIRLILIVALFLEYCQLNEKNPELSTIVPLQSRSV